MIKNVLGLITCILMVIVGSFMLAEQIKLGNNTIEVMATVGDHAGIVGRKNLNNSYYVNYTVDGKEYHETYYSDRSLSKGDRVRIRVGKDNPKIVEQANQSVSVLLILAGFIYGFVCAMKIYKKETD